MHIFYVCLLFFFIYLHVLQRFCGVYTYKYFNRCVFLRISFSFIIAQKQTFLLVPQYVLHSRLYMGLDSLSNKSSREVVFYN